MNFPLIICLAIVACAMTFVGGLVAGNMIPGNSLGQDSLSAWVSALSAVVVCALTIMLAIETWRLRAAQSRQMDDMRRESVQPNMSVELVPNRVGVNFMDVMIRNHGKGIARKIKFDFLDRDGNPIDEINDPLVLAFRKLAMFKLGLESVGVGHELRTFVFSFIELGQKVDGKIFELFLNIKVSYRDVAGREYFEIFSIDFAQYEGFGTLGEDPLSQIAKELKLIRERMPALQNGRIGIDMFDSTDRTAELDENRLRRADLSRQYSGA